MNRLSSVAQSVDAGSLISLNAGWGCNATTAESPHREFPGSSPGGAILYGGSGDSVAEDGRRTGWLETPNARP